MKKSDNLQSDMDHDIYWSCIEKRELSKNDRFRCISVGIIEYLEPVFASYHAIW